MEQNINALYPRSKGRGSTAIFDSDELKKKRLLGVARKFSENIKLAHGSDTNVATIGARASILGIFFFRAVLNLAMLVTESERAKTIRSRMLNIVIDVIAKKIRRQHQVYQPAQQRLSAVSLHGRKLPQAVYRCHEGCYGTFNALYPRHKGRGYKALFL